MKSQSSFVSMMPVTEVFSYFARWGISSRFGKRLLTLKWIKCILLFLNMLPLLPLFELSLITTVIWAITYHHHYLSHHLSPLLFELSLIAIIIWAITYHHYYLSYHLSSVLFELSIITIIIWAITVNIKLIFNPVNGKIAIAEKGSHVTRYCYALL